MMTIIKRALIILSVFVIVFVSMPVISFAVENGDPLEYQLINFDVIGDTYTIISRYTNGSTVFNGVNWSNRPYGSNQNFCLVYVPSGYDNNFRLCCKTNGVININSSPTYIYPYAIVNQYGSFYTTSYSANVPMFIESVGWNTNTSSPAYQYIMNGVLSDTQNVIGYGPFEPISSDELGFIKNPAYILRTGSNFDNTTTTFERITWDKTKSTTDFQYDSNTIIEFSLRDKTTYHKDFAGDVQFMEPVLRLADSTFHLPIKNSVDLAWSKFNWALGYVFPYGDDTKALLKGKALKVDSSYDKMIKSGQITATSGFYDVNALGVYKSVYTGSGTTGVDYNFGNYLNNVVSSSNTGFDRKAWYQRAWEHMEQGGFDFNWSYDIYARIVHNGTAGKWLKINKHSVPMQEQENTLDGGTTIEPVDIPDYTPSDTFTPTHPETPISPPSGSGSSSEINDDTVFAQPIGTGIDPSDDGSGSGTVINNYNYTYNYDNRQWIENNYNNETVQQANEGFDILKTFGSFFGLFRILLGGFFPEWCIVLVEGSVVVLGGLIILKAIKSVIPFM